MSAIYHDALDKAVDITKCAVAAHSGNISSPDEDGAKSVSSFLEIVYLKLVELEVDSNDRFNNRKP